jgi:uncharacterized protein YcbK (DUF882 family)
MRKHQTPFDPRRRDLLKGAAALVSGLLLVGPAAALASSLGAAATPLTDSLLGPNPMMNELPLNALASPRMLSLYNVNTDERLDAVFWSDGRLQPDALRRIDHILRDYRTGEVKEIDVRLLHLLHDLKTAIGTGEPFNVLSGYRSAATNAMLHRESPAVALHSLHIQGMAIDIRIPGTRLAGVRDAALNLGRGGVGYYPDSDFVHVDVGRPRFW